MTATQEKPEGFGRCQGGAWLGRRFTGFTVHAFILPLGFVPLTLYLTGFMRWRQKRRGRR